ncbi:MAG: zinc ribbon domain-containing protein [Thermoplasmata archaeon]
MTEPIAEGTWGECLYCGDAVPPGSKVCPICGAENPIRASQIPIAPKKIRRRLKGLGALRTAMVVGAILLLAYAVISPVFSGPPVIADPLTASGTYFISTGNSTVLAGEVTGADYILGNWTVLAPFGTSVGLTVYNSTEYNDSLHGIPTGNQLSYAPANEQNIVFTAEVTDTYYFVFANPYPLSSGLNLTVFISTAYTPSVNSVT